MTDAEQKVIDKALAWKAADLDLRACTDPSWDATCEKYDRATHELDLAVEELGKERNQ